VRVSTALHRIHAQQQAAAQFGGQRLGCQPLERRVLETAERWFTKGGLGQAVVGEEWWREAGGVLVL
jgi:hypothetical protein